MAHWEHFDHGADIGIRGIGASKASAFEQAALALTAVICDPAEVRASTEVALQCSAASDELLLLAWLNALVSEMALRTMLFSGFAVELGQGWLRARASGEALAPARHQPAVEVKGATLSELVVQQLPGDQGWLAQTVVDV